MKLIPLKTADEYDTFSKWRKVSIKRAGKFKAVKRFFNKRVRRLKKLEIKNAEFE